MPINLRMWLFGGLVAGAIMLASGVTLAHFALGPKYMAEVRAQLPAPPGAWTIARNTLVRLGFGLIALFLYAGFRPRFGPGPRTAVIAGITIWLAGYLPLSMGLADRGLLTGARLGLSLTWSLAEACLATVTGAWIYRERTALILALLAAISGGAMPGSAIAAEPMHTAAAVDTATFAGGCFWCMEPPFEALMGVASVTSGFSGGPEVGPTYAQVSAGETGHMESIQIIYDPKKITYSRLLDVYWHNIDPTQANGQFCDHGTQYRSAIFYRGDAQRSSAERSKKAIENSRQLKQPIVTPIIRFKAFYPAEGYHQDYYRKNPDHYHAYRAGCGRDRRLQALWGVVK